MARYTVIQSGDFNAAENVGALAGDIKREGIVDGLELSNLDTAAPSVDVAAGKTVHIVPTQVAEATLDDGSTVSEQRDQVQIVAHVDSQTVSLTDGTVNELFLDPQVNTDDSARVEVATTGTPSSNAVKIGEVDTSADTVSGQFNKIEPDGTLSFPDASAASAALSSLPTGVGVIDRANDVLIYDDKVSATALEADTITDGADVSHTGELADSSDVSAIQSSGDVTVTDTQPGAVSDQEFLKNEGGNLTGGTVQTEPNVPSYVEDDNSPITLSNDTFGSISLSQTYDVVKMIVVSNNNKIERLDITVNNDQTFGYKAVKEDGSRTSGGSVADCIAVPTSVGKEIRMAGDWGTGSGQGWSASFDIAEGFGAAVTGANNKTVSPPLDSIELRQSDGNPVSLSARVYGIPQ